LKLLFTQDALVNAGAERSHLEILSRFSKDTEPTLVYFSPTHELKKKYEEAGVRLYFLDVPESYHLPLAVFRLLRLIRKEKPELLISSLWRADIITRIASLISGVPLIGTLVNDSYSPMAQKDKRGLKYRMVYWLDRVTAGIPRHWIANSQALADSHVKTLGLKRECISVVYRGRPIPHHGTYSRLGFTIKHFLSYGRLLDRKGFQDAIMAFSQVKKSYPECTLTIFGEGYFRKDLELLIQNLAMEKSVFLPGKISDPTNKLNLGCLPLEKKSSHPTSDIRHPADFHCFLFPSRYEGFSGALVEAMMSGIPIIASDIPMNLEAVTQGKTALTFKVGDCKDLVEKMTFAIGHPSQMAQMGKEARGESLKRFDIEKIAREYENQVLMVFNDGFNK
jgi:glycosyltransferase involved in cell wall biosynthesis